MRRGGGRESERERERERERGRGRGKGKGKGKGEGKGMLLGGIKEFFFSSHLDDHHASSQ